AGVEARPGGCQADERMGGPPAEDGAKSWGRWREATAREPPGGDAGHAALVGELPQVFGPAADADLDCALRIQYPGQHGLPERPAVMELGTLERAARVAMGVDVHETDGLLRTHRLQDWQRDRMVAPDAHRPHPRRHKLCIERLDILMALLKAEAAAEGDIADVGDDDLGQRR